MSVIPQYCTLASESSPGCGCAVSRNASGKAAGAAAMTASLAAAACTACCILPFTLPAVVLAGTGGLIAVLDHAHGSVTRLAILAVACAWLWIAWQVRKTQRRPARATVSVMILATLVTAATASWPMIGPVAYNALGIVKQRTVSPSER